MLDKLQLFKNNKLKTNEKKKSEDYTSIPIKIKEKEDITNIDNKDRNYIFNNHIQNNIDDKFWTKCIECGEYTFNKELEENLFVCPKCNKHMRIPARDRIEMLTDRGSFIEFNKEIKFSESIDKEKCKDLNEEIENYTDKIDRKILIDPLKFPNYSEKIFKYKEKTGEFESVITGVGRINGIRFVLCVMNPDFMMGSMGSVTGDKIAYAFEYGAENEIPVVVCSASGGARMQEGMLSLMQMAKTSRAIGKLSEKKQPYISILTDPTTGGVTASFAMLGDIIISEPKTLIGFAGKRVVLQTIGGKLPDNFQTAEFMMEHGFLDMIVERKNLKDTIYKILYLHKRK